MTDIHPNSSDPRTARHRLMTGSGHAPASAGREGGPTNACLTEVAPVTRKASPDRDRTGAPVPKRQETIMLYSVTATRKTVAVGDWQGSVQVPTFYLDSNVQGIVSCEHAARIALEVIGPDAYGVTVMNGAGETVSFTNTDEAESWSSS